MDLPPDELCDDLLPNFDLDVDLPMILDEVESTLMKTEPLDFPFLSETTTKDHEAFQWSPETQQSFPDIDDFDKNLKNINPYDFLNDVIVDDIKMENESNARNTPSPSSSSGFSDVSETNSMITLENGISQKVPDTPPYSPPSDTMDSSSSASSPNPVYLSPMQDVKIIHGTLIPCTTIPMTLSGQKATNTPLKTIKIQPKPLTTASGGVMKPNNNNLGRRTIVLSQQEFGALMQKTKTTPVSLAQKPIIVPKMLTPVKTTTHQPKVLAQVKTEPVSVEYNIGTGIFSRDVDEKTLKKQQRMIKNRESACLSRKKKKEYVTALESRVNELTNENERLQHENNELKKRLSRTECTKCSKNKFFKLNLPVLPRKNAAILLACLFVVSCNIFPLTNLISSREEGLSAPEPAVGRRLLWTDETEKNDTMYDPNTSPSQPNLYPICPSTQYINQTESIRIASDLRKWIGDSEKQEDEEKSNLHATIEVEAAPTGDSSLIHVPKKSRMVVKKKPRSKRRVRLSGKGETALETGNQVQVFKPKEQTTSVKYSDLFEEIHRRDDTFYVVSFHADLLMLPAMAHNKTRRPRMSLLLPAVGINDSITTESMTMMQIDCEVIDTSLIRVKHKFIPEHLRTPSTRYQANSSSGAGKDRNSPYGKVDIGQRNIGDHEEQPLALRKPFFIDDNILEKTAQHTREIDFT
ncbi:hypothetical protein DMENIID0001_046290 [Sergentomyia squamirostris]